MSFIFNGVNIDTVYMNGVLMDEVYFNGVLVFSGVVWEWVFIQEHSSPQTGDVNLSGDASTIAAAQADLEAAFPASENQWLVGIYEVEGEDIFYEFESQEV